MSDRAVLAHWLAEIKIAQRALNEAKADGEKWFKRAKFAMTQGEMEMASQAKAQAVEARERYVKAATRLSEAEIGRDMAAQELRDERVSGPANAAAARALHTAEQFESMGIDTRFAGLGSERDSALREAASELDTFDQSLGSQPSAAVGAGVGAAVGAGAPPSAAPAGHAPVEDDAHALADLASADPAHLDGTGGLINHDEAPTSTPEEQQAALERLRAKMTPRNESDE
ncbi:MAG: hypothetical protein ACI81R_003261 [Bradymonadia bacterium]|jgi:hypothetical protein